ncbi:MAG: tetratricopeptide repeat protein, partial [Saprospiraceae bacterium]|nr:tetratricopeptide repeat protein [Saprospiraceae bacterium]
MKNLLFVLSPASTLSSSPRNPYRLFTLQNVASIILVTSILMTANAQNMEGIQYSMSDTTEAAKFIDSGKKLINTRELSKAFDLLKKACIILQDIGYSQSDKMADALHLIGNIYNLAPKKDSALAYYYQSVEIRIKIHGEKNIDLAKTYNNIGLTLIDLNLYDKAEYYILKSLNIKINLIPENDPSIAKAYNNIGFFFIQKGEYDQAIYYFEKGRCIRESDPSYNSEELSGSYINLSNAYLKKGDYGRAIQFGQHAVNILEKNNLIDKHFYVEPISIIGTCYYMLGDIQKSILYHKKSLHARLNILKNNDIGIATALNDLGICYMDIREFEKALEYFNDALDKLSPSYTENIRSDGRIIALINYNIGNVFSLKQDYQQAIAYYQKALETWIELLGSEHDDIAKVYSGLAFCYHALGKHEQAIKENKKALSILEKKVGLVNIETAKVLNNLGLVYLDIQQFNQALEYLDQAIVASGFEES